MSSGKEISGRKNKGRRDKVLRPDKIVGVKAKKGAAARPAKGGKKIKPVPGQGKTESDISKLVSILKPVEEEVKKIFERYSIATHAAKLGIWEWDIENNVFVWDDVMYELYGVKKENFPGAYEAWLNGIHPDDRMHGHTESQLALRGEKNYNTEFRIIRPDGNVRYIKAYGNVIRDFKGRPLKMIGINYDITKQKAAEEALKESEEKFRTLAEQSPNMIFINRSGRIVYANAKCEEMMGYTKEEFYSADFNFLKLTAPEHIEALKGYYQTHMKGEDIPAYEYAVLTKDGKRLDVIITTKLILYENKKAILGIITDITERKQSEQYLEKIGNLKRRLIGRGSINDKLKLITDGLVDIFGADFARIWITKEGDICEKGCIHAVANGSAEKCLDRTRCLHLVSSSGRYTSTDGGHTRVPFGAYKIGRVASGEDDKFITNNVTGDPRVHDHEWAKSLGLTSYAGFKITSKNELPIGVMALFRTKNIEKFEEKYLEDLADTASQVIMAATAEDALKTVAKEWQTTFDSSYDAYCILDGDQKIRQVNSKMSDMFLIKQEEMIGRYCWEVVHGTSEPIMNCPVVRMKKTLRRESLELVRNNKYYDITVDPILDETGNLVSAVHIVRDISGRKDAENALRKSEMRYRALIENQNDLISRYKPDTTLTFVNDSYCRFYGKQREELIGSSFLTLVAPEFHEVVLKETAEIAKDPRPVKGEYLNFRQDGNECWIQWIIQGIVDENGTVTELQAVGRDITDRKLAEEKLKESEEHFRAFIENASIGACLVGLDNRFVSVNETMCELIGYTEDELRCLTFNDVTHPDDRGISSEKVAKLVSGEMKKFSLEKRYKHKNGQTVWGLVSSSLIRDNKGDPRYFVTHVQDITERKRLEEQLLQSQKMLSIGTLAGGIAHDFNNLLGIILGYSQLLENYKGDEKKFSDSIAAINQTIQRGAALVRQILTFARKTDVEFDSIRVADVVHELFSMLQQTFPRVISFNEEYEKDLPCIYADHTQIHQALLNLCVNARDAMPSGGTISISAKQLPLENVNLRFPAADQDSYVCVTVSDTGAGMDESTRLRIFDPFFTTKPIGKGTGMGLPVVYGIVHAHHGFIDVESRSGQGSAFHLYFPVLKKRRNKDDTDRKMEEPSPGGTETILLVEDEELLLDMVRIMLQSMGYTVYCAGDGIEAVDVFKQHRSEIDLILSDMGLPGLSGMDEFRKLREIDPNVRVIFASGFFEPNTKSELLAAGAEGFVQKPYESSDILRTVREVLDRR